MDRRKTEVGPGKDDQSGDLWEGKGESRRDRKVSRGFVKATSLSDLVKRDGAESEEHMGADEWFDAARHHLENQRNFEAAQVSAKVAWRRELLRDSIVVFIVAYIVFSLLEYLLRGTLE